MATSIAACMGAKTAPLTTTKPLMTANNIGMTIEGFTGRGRSGSRKRRMMAPSTVRKKKAYSASPLSVRRMRILPSRMYTADRTVLRMRALLARVRCEFDEHA